jgi:hypothetical protein
MLNQLSTGTTLPFFLPGIEILAEVFQPVKLKNEKMCRLQQVQIF